MGYPDVIKRSADKALQNAVREQAISRIQDALGLEQYAFKDVIGDYGVLNILKSGDPRKVAEEAVKQSVIQYFNIPVPAIGMYMVALFAFAFLISGGTGGLRYSREYLARRSGESYKNAAINFMNEIYKILLVDLMLAELYISIDNLYDAVKADMDARKLEYANLLKSAANMKPLNGDKLLAQLKDPVKYADYKNNKKKYINKYIMPISCEFRSNVIEFE